MSKRIAIFVASLDAHAEAVAWALGKKGVSVDLIRLADAIDGGAISVTVANDQKTRALLCTDSRRLNLCDYDGFWLRRPMSLPDLCDRLHPDDINAVRVEWREFLTSLLLVLQELGKVCINSPQAILHEVTKLHQLQLARDLGFRIPLSCVGNDFPAVSLTFEGRKEVAFKSFVPPAGSVKGRPRFTPTTLVPLDSSIWKSLRLSPGIVQQYIDKKYEARVTVIGKQMLAVGIDSQSTETSRYDWRTPEVYGHGSRFFFPIREIPAAVESRISNFCQRLGLDYCALDFIVDPHDDWVFLEGNPSGQFLFCEAAVPEAKILDTFSNFLAARIGARVSNTSVSYQEFLDSAEGLDFEKRSRAQQQPRGSA